MQAAIGGKQMRQEAGTRIGKALRQGGTWFVVMYPGTEAAVEKWEVVGMNLVKGIAKVMVDGGKDRSYFTGDDWWGGTVSCRAFRNYWYAYKYSGRREEHELTG